MIRQETEARTTFYYISNPEHGGSEILLPHSQEANMFSFVQEATNHFRTHKDKEKIFSLTTLWKRNFTPRTLWEGTGVNLIFYYDFLSFSIIHISICNIWIGNRFNFPRLTSKHLQTSFINRMAYQEQYIEIYHQ